MYICIDFDGTIVDHVFPAIGQPVPGALNWLKKFTEAGGRNILFTMRSDGQEVGSVLTNAVKFLEDRGIELFGINKNPHQHWSSSPKAYGHVYIDDAAYGCPLIQPRGFNRPCVDWGIVGPDIYQRIKSKVKCS